MSYILKSLFNFTNAKQKELQISTKFSKIQALIKELDKQKQTDLPLKLKAILSAAFFEQKGESLFELIYKNASQSSPVEWVPMIGKSVALFSGNSTFMKIIFDVQDYKIPIQKHFIPNYLFKNNLLNENSGYQGLSNSISGLMVPIMDYVFIRLLHAINEIEFIPISRDLNTEYQTDDIFLYISRNPYLLLLRNYLQYFATSQRQLGKLVGNVKMFFVDELILKHRINKSSSYLKESSRFSSQRKIKPHYLLVTYLLLHQGRGLFDEKYMFFYELISRFGSLIQADNEVFFRFLTRVFLYVYSKSSAQNKVIEQLQKANQKDGVFALERYSIDKYKDSIRSSDTTEKKQFNDSKTLLLKLLEKDYNLMQNGRIHFSIIRTLGCFLVLDMKMNQLSNEKRLGESSDSLRVSSEATSLQIAIEKICIQAVLMKQNKSKVSQPFNKTNEENLNKEIQQIRELYHKAYNRLIENSKFEGHKETKSAAEIGVRGNSEDFTFSVETYRRDIEINCWKVPLKDSEYLILYELFYAIAKSIDRYIPGSNPSKEPRINLRYFCNPFMFMFTVIVLIVFLKVIF